MEMEMVFAWRSHAPGRMGSPRVSLKEGKQEVGAGDLGEVCKHCGGRWSPRWGVRRLPPNRFVLQSSGGQETSTKEEREVKNTLWRPETGALRPGLRLTGCVTMGLTSSSPWASFSHL